MNILNTPPSVSKPASNILTYHKIIREIDQNVDLVSLPEREKKEWEQIIRQKIDSLMLEKKDGNEDLAMANLYLLLFHIKTKRLKDPLKIEHQYNIIKKYFLEEERELQDKIRGAQKEKERKLLYNQLLYYYKMLEFYMTYLEKTLGFFSFSDLSKKVYADKIHFLQKHQLLEKNLKKFFAYLRLSFKLTLRKYLFIYALLGGIGIVLFWHGVWGMTDWIIVRFDIAESFLSYAVTTFLGVIILYSLGIFLDQTIGDKGSTQNIEEMESEDMSELRSLNKAIQNKKNTKL